MKEIDFFKLFFTEELVAALVLLTNTYAHSILPMYRTLETKWRIRGRHNTGRDLQVPWTCLNDRFDPPSQDPRLLEHATPFSWQLNMEYHPKSATLSGSSHIIQGY